MSVRMASLFISWLACAGLLAWPGDARGGSGAERDVLAFAREGSVWVCTGDGGGRRELCPGFLPGLGPDGRTVAFFRSGGGKGQDSADELWLHDLVSGGERRLAAGLAAYSPPVWSGDGRTVAVLARDGQGMTQIVALRSDGSGRRILFAEGDSGAGFLCSLSPSPDGALVTHDMVAAYWIGPDGKLKERVPLEEDCYWIDDLLGLRVVEQDTGRDLGRLENVISTGSNDVYGVRTPDGALKMLPAIADVVRKVDLEAGTMTVVLLEGLWD